MVKVPYEKAHAEVVQYDDSDVIQTASTRQCVLVDPGSGRGCWISTTAFWYSGDGDKPVID